jgi:hypothetical protein
MIVTHYISFFRHVKFVSYIKEQWVVKHRDTQPRSRLHKIVKKEKKIYIKISLFHLEKN